MRPSKSFLFKAVSILVTFTFLIADIGWAIPDGIPGDYTPFDESQQQSGYLTEDQLQRFSDTKDSLVQKYNDEHPGEELTEENDIIQYLYDILNPEEYSTLEYLEDECINSIAAREAAEDDYNEQQALLDGYLQEAEDARTAIEKVDQQIEVFNNRKNGKKHEKQVTLDDVSDLQSQIEDKEATISTILDEISALETELDELNADLIIFQQELNDLLDILNVKQDEVQTAQDAHDSALADYKAAVDLVQADLGEDFDIHTAEYERIYGGGGNLIEVILPAEYQTLPNIEEIEANLLDALLKYETFQDAEALLSQKEEDLDAAQAAYDEKDDECAVQKAGITQTETDLLSGYEKVKLIEADISVLNEAIDTKNAHCGDIDGLISDLDASIADLNATKSYLEQQYLDQLDELEARTEEAESILLEKEGVYKEALEKEKRAMAAYETALAERESVLTSLNKVDKKLQVEIISALLKEEGEEVQLEQLEGMTPEEMDQILLRYAKRLVLLNGRADRMESVRRAHAETNLRKTYIKVFGREPSERILSVMQDIILNTKIPAIRIFEVIRRIEQRKLEGREDSEKLEPEQETDLLQRVMDRLQGEDLGASLITGALSYLTSLPKGLITCGTIALANLFSSLGREDVSAAALTEEAILTDIIAGSINKDTEGDLKLSLHALKNAAETKGMMLYGQKITSGDLGSIGSPFIAHVNGDHYVLVYGVKNGRVELFDPAVDDEKLTGLQEFSQSFTGNILTLSKSKDGILLSDEEMKGIHGAWFKSFSRAVSKAVSSVSKAVSSVSKSISKAVSSVSKSVSKAVSSVSSSVSKAVSSVSHSVSSAVSNASNAVRSVTSSVSSSVSKAVSHVSSAVSNFVSGASTAVKNAASSAVKAVSSGVSSAVTAISSGVSNSVTALGSSVTSAASSAYNTLSNTISTGVSAISDFSAKGTQAIQHSVSALSVNFNNLVTGAGSLLASSSGFVSSVPAPDPNAGQSITPELSQDLGQMVSPKVDLTGKAIDTGIYDLEGAPGADSCVSIDPQLQPMDPAMIGTESGEVSYYDAEAVQNGVCVAEDMKDLRFSAENMPAADASAASDATGLNLADLFGNTILNAVMPVSPVTMMNAAAKAYDWATGIPGRFTQRYGELTEKGAPPLVAGYMATNYATGGHIIEGEIKNAMDRFSTRTQNLITGGEDANWAQLRAGILAATDYLGGTDMACALSGRDSITFKDDLEPLERLTHGIDGSIKLASVACAYNSAIGSLVKPGTVTTAHQVTYGPMKIGSETFTATCPPSSLTVGAGGTSATYSVIVPGQAGISLGKGLLDILQSEGLQNFSDSLKNSTQKYEERKENLITGGESKETAGIKATILSIADQFGISDLLSSITGINSTTFQADLSPAERLELGTGGLEQLESRVFPIAATEEASEVCIDTGMSYASFIDQNNMSTAEDKQDSAPVSVSSILAGTGIGSLFKHYITEEAVKNIPGVVDAYFKGGSVPLRDLILDIGGGKVSPHLGSINLDKQAITVGIQNAIKTESHADMIEVLKWLNKEGAGAKKIFFENVPWDDIQTPQIAKEAGDLLQPGGVEHLVPRPAPGVLDQGVSSFKESADDIAELFVKEADGILTKPTSMTRIIRPDEKMYTDVLEYTIVKNPSLLGRAGNTALKVLKYAAPALVAAGLVLDGLDLYNAYREDEEQGGGCSLESTTGRVIGAWGGAIAGAKAVGAVGLFGGPWGAVIGGAGGAIVGGIAGYYAGGAVCEIAGTDVSEPAEEDASAEPSIAPSDVIADYHAPRPPMHETISYDVTPDISLINPLDGSQTPSISTENLTVPPMPKTPVHETISSGVDYQDASAGGGLFGGLDLELINKMYPMGPTSMINSAIKGYNWAKGMPDRYSQRYEELSEGGMPEVMAGYMALNYATGGHVIEDIIKNTGQRYGIRKESLIARGDSEGLAKFEATLTTVNDFTGLTSLASAITGIDSLTFQSGLEPLERIELGIDGTIQAAMTILLVSSAVKAASGALTAAESGVTYAPATATVGAETYAVTQPTAVIYEISGSGASATYSISAVETGINLLETSTAAETAATSPKNFIGRQSVSEYSGSKMTRIKADMIKNGYTGPPVEAFKLNGKNVILDGHHRVRAAGAAGLDEIPVKFITEEELVTRWKLTPAELQMQVDEALMQRELMYGTR